MCNLKWQVLYLMVVAAESERQLGALLRGSGAGVLSIGAKDASFSGTVPDITLLRHKRLRRVAADCAALILQGGWIPGKIECAHTVAIVDSSSSRAMALAASRRLPALTCGLSSSDTFTFSSLTADSAVIALRRQICAFDKSVVEPFELPVSFTAEAEPFSLLAGAAVLCLLGERNPLTKLSLWELPALS